VIVPVYNAEAHIEKCAHSILSQSFKNLQVVFVDDASTDASLEMLRRFEHDPRCRVIRRSQRKGPGPARNQALRFAHGDYVCFVDSDDWIDPDYIAQLVQKTVETGADLVVGPYRSVRSRGVKTHRAQPLTLDGDMVALTAVLNSQVDALPAVTTRIFRRRIIAEGHLRFSDAPTGEDFEFNLRYLFACRTVAYADVESYYYYRQEQSESITNSFRSEYIDGYEHIICVVREYERANHLLHHARAFRCYELYTSCLKKVLKASLTAKERRRHLERTVKTLRPLATSPLNALLFLVTTTPISWRYRLRKLRKVFVVPTTLRLRYYLSWERLASRR